MDHSSQLRSWFLSLTSDDRVNALVLEDRVTVKLAVSMFYQRESKGDGYFFDFNADATSSQSPLVEAASAALRATKRTSLDDTHSSSGRINRRSRDRSHSSSSQRSATDQPYDWPQTALPPVSCQQSFGFKSADRLLPLFHSSATKKAAEQRLSDSVRLCDTREYCDTMTVVAELVNEDKGKAFLSLMESLSNSRFLSTPCTITLDAAKRPQLEVPAWFRALGYFSFSTWLASKLEQQLWLRYFESKSLADSQRPSSASSSNTSRISVRERLNSKQPLEAFWITLGRERREKIFVKLTALIETVRRRDDFNHSNNTDDSKSETSHSTNVDASDWLAFDDTEEQKSLSPAILVSPSSSSLLASANGQYHDINSAPITKPRRSRSRSLPRRKPSLPTSTISTVLQTPLHTRSLKTSARQISIPCSMDSVPSSSLLLSESTSPTQSMTPTSSASSVPSRSSTPPPHLRYRSSSALSASSTPKLSQQSRRKTASERKRQKKRDRQRTNHSANVETGRLSRGKTRSWDASGNVTPLTDPFDDNASVHSINFDSSIANAMHDQHQFNRGMQHLLTLIQALQRDAFNDTQPEKMLTASTPKPAQQRLIQRSSDLSAPSTPLVRSMSQSSSMAAQPQESCESSSMEAATAMPVSQPTPSPLNSFNDAGELPMNELWNINDESSLLRKPSSPPSLTLTLAELRTTPLTPHRVPLPPPTDLCYENFIDFLFYSPLARAHTSLDLVIRRMGVIVQNVFAETIGMDLITGEDNDEDEGDGGVAKCKKKLKAKKKKAKKRASLPHQSPSLSSQSAPLHQSATGEDSLRSSSDSATKQKVTPVNDEAVAPDDAADSEHSSNSDAHANDTHVESEEKSASSSDDDSTVRSAEAQEAGSSSGEGGWTEVKREEKRRERRRVPPSSRAKDDFFYSASFIPHSHPSQPLSRTSIISASSLPPRAPARAKDDIYTDRAPRTFGLTSLPLSRGVSIQGGSPSWAKISHPHSTHGNARSPSTSTSVRGNSPSPLLTATPAPKQPNMSPTLSSTAAPTPTTIQPLLAPAALVQRSSSSGPPFGQPGDEKLTHKEPSALLNVIFPTPMPSFVASHSAPPDVSVPPSSALAILVSPSKPFNGSSPSSPAQQQQHLPLHTSSAPLASPASVPHTSMTSPPLPPVVSAVPKLSLAELIALHEEAVKKAQPTEPFLSPRSQVHMQYQHRCASPTMQPVSTEPAASPLRPSSVAPGVIPPMEEMRAAVMAAQAAAGSRLNGLPGPFPVGRPDNIPQSAWQSASKFWQEQQRLMMIDHQNKIMHHKPARSGTFSGSQTTPITETHQQPSSSEPPQQPPQLRTYVRGPLMTGGSPQYTRQSSHSSGQATPTTPNPPPSLRRERSGSLKSQSQPQSQQPLYAHVNVHSMVRSYERAAAIEAMNVQRGWDQQRPVLSLASYPSNSSSPSPSPSSPLSDYSQPHSAPIIAPHFTTMLNGANGVNARYTPTRPHRPVHCISPSLEHTDSRRLSLACPPWLDPPSLPFFLAHTPIRSRELSLATAGPRTLLPNYMLAPANVAIHASPAYHPSADSNGFTAIDTKTLHAEIDRFTCHCIRLSQSRHALLMSLMLRVRDCVWQLWPSAQVHCYGSFMTGLGLPSSDLDLAVVNVSGDRIIALRMLAARLKQQNDWVQSVNAIDTARVPVIKVSSVTDSGEAIVDITFDSTTEPSNDTGLSPSQSLESVHRTRSVSQPQILESPTIIQPHLQSPISAHTGVASVELITHYAAIFPALRPLTLVLKQFLFDQRLSSTYTGGLNSYCLVLMIVSFFQSKPWPYRYYHSHLQQVQRQIWQQQQHRQLIQQQCRQSLPTPPPTSNTRFSNGSDAMTDLPVGDADYGSLLLEFLEFFGERFDFSRMGIAVAPPPTMPHLVNHLSTPAHSANAIGMSEIMGKGATTGNEDGSIVGCFYHLPSVSQTLHLSDPFSPPLDHNIGKSVFAMWKIKAALELGLALLRGTTGNPTHGPPLTHAPTILSRLFE